MPPGGAGDDRSSLGIRRAWAGGAVGLVVGFILGGLTVRAWGPPARAAVPAAAARAADPNAPVLVPVRVAVPTEGRPALGNAMARLTVVEFTDYSCPFCRRHATTTLAPLMQRYGSRIRYVVMNFPIAELHPDAPLAAEAAECAADQGKFWEYHDTLFQSQPHDRASLKRFARDLHLDGARFDRCLDSGAKKRLVDDQVRLGNAVGVSGTPAFVIGNQMVEGAYPLAALGKVIDGALGS